MKTIVTYCIFMIFTVPRIGAVELRDGDRAVYQQLEKTDDKTKRVIAQLENIEITDISFEKLTATEAMDYLIRKSVGEKSGGVINCVIRGVDKAKKVGITNMSQTYTQVVDEICRQSGKVWLIEFNEVSGAPVLVIKNKNGQQAAPSNR